MASSYQDNRSVEIAGPAALKGLQPVRLSGSEQISRPFEYELHLIGDDAATPDADKILGQSATVTLTMNAAGARRHFNGIVTEFAHVGYGERFHEYRAVLRPSFWLLTRRADCRIFQNKSTPDIFAAVCGQGGAVEFRNALSSQYAPWEYRVQYRESDFDFLSRLLEHDGLYYYFEHFADKHVLVLTDDVGKLSPVSGYDEVPYYPPSTTPAQRERDHLESWAVHKSFQPASFASREYNFEAPTAIASGASTVAQRKDPSKFEIFEYPAGARELTSTDVERIAKLRAQQMQSAQAVARSEGDAAGLGAGRVFKLKGYPRADANKKYLITSTKCELTSDSAQTGAAAAAPQFAIAIEAVDATAPYRPERTTPKPVIQGTQTARVVGSSNQEIWTDKYGRVKVQFHWDRAGKSDDTSSCWVRVAQSWAGKNWGAQYVPRVGQEVVVSFLEGDPDRPIIIGSVYNAEQMPPYALPGSSTQSGIKTRTREGAAANFNEIRFEDKKDEEELYLHAERNMQVVVENDQTITIGSKKDKGDRTVTIENDDKLTVRNDVVTEVKGKESHTVDKDRTTTVKGDDTADVKQKLTLKAGSQITLEVGSAKIVMKSDGTIEISGSQLKLSGSARYEIDAPQGKVSGTQVEITGTRTAVQGSGMLDLASSGAASLKGSITKIG